MILEICITIYGGSDKNNIKHSSQSVYITNWPHCETNDNAAVSWQGGNLPQLSYHQRMHRPAQHFDDHSKQMQQCLSGGKLKGIHNHFYVAKYTKQDQELSQ